MGTKHQSSDPNADPKKRKRVKFLKIDDGVEANDCIKIYLVSGKEEVDSPNSFCLEPVDLNHFFEEDGKIFGYQDLKITIWISSVSFLAYADITFDSKSDNGKGITDLKTALQNIFADNLVESKDDFLQTFSTESNYVKSLISDCEVLLQKPSKHSNEDASNVEVIRITGELVGPLYCRLIPLVLLLVDGSNPIDITDPRWEIYVLVQKKADQQEDGDQVRLLGFAALYRYYHYPDSIRLRLSQILVLPPYQKSGHGQTLVELLNKIAISENAYDLTIEEPLDVLQHMRTCIDVQRLLAFDQIQPALNSAVARLKQENLSKKTTACKFNPPSEAIESVRKTLKINKKQLKQCWEVLIYLCLDPIAKYIENYRILISDSVKADVIGKDSGAAGKRLIDVPSEFDQETSFVMFKTKNGEANNSIELDENLITVSANVEEQLKQLVDERMKEIESIAEKVSSDHS
jgi:histone acetyltransferase 1